MSEQCLDKIHIRDLLLRCVLGVYDEERREKQDVNINVWHIQTAVSARALKFGILRGIETDLGHARSADKYAARPIDLDLAVYGDAVIDEPDLHVPDPDIRERPFVAVPLLGLAPNLVMPDTGEPLALCRSSGSPTAWRPQRISPAN